MSYVNKGGSGSGNFGHSGRPGAIGGSGDDGGGGNNQDSLSSISDDLHSNITSNELSALNYYQDTGYRQINHPLRHSDVQSTDQNFEQHVKDIDSAFSKVSPLEDNITVMRGIDDVAQFKVGDSFTDKGYVSTTLNESIAKDFSSGQIVSITISKGAKVIPLTNKLSISRNKSEKEILIKRGSSFKITKIDKDVPFGGGTRKFTIIHAVKE